MSFQSQDSSPGILSGLPGIGENESLARLGAELGADGREEHGRTGKEARRAANPQPLVGPQRDLEDTFPPGGAPGGVARISRVSERVTLPAPLGSERAPLELVAGTWRVCPVFGGLLWEAVPHGMWLGLL